MRLAIVLSLVLGAYGSFAQQKPQPPEYKALQDARKIEDRGKRIEALRAVIAKYPKHGAAQDARFSILEATVDKSPDNREEVLQAAKKYVKKAPKDSRRSANRTAAAQLLKCKPCLPEAEQYARKALTDFKQDKFFEEMKNSAAKEKRPAPTQEEMIARFNNSRAPALETLGLILVAQGRTGEGRPLLEDAVKADPMRADASVAVADLEEKAGNEPKALDYLYFAQLSGRISKPGRESLERLHRKTNDGSLDGIDAKLDDVYRKRFPLPFHPDTYTPPTGRTDRVVLAEIFTGSGCPPCASVDVAFDAVLERYPRSDVAVLMYHQHIPRPDPMAHPASEARFKSYARGGVPTFVIDGQVDGGGGPRETAKSSYTKINGIIEKRLTVPSQAKLRLQATSADGGVEIEAAVEPSANSRKAVLHVALAEEMLRYSGENGIRFHPMVVRDLAEFEFDTQEPLAAKHRFDIAKIEEKLKSHLDDYEENGRHGKIKFSEKKHDIDPAKLVVVAFIQDSESKEILQSLHVKPNGAKVISAR
jgi:thiol-disulfide isomerase/thioredoxin